MIALLYIVAAVVSALFIGVEGAHAALPPYHAWKHGRCLVRIAVLERSLGIEVSNPELLPRSKSLNYTQALYSYGQAKPDERNAAFWKAHDREMKRQIKAERGYQRRRGF